MDEITESQRWWFSLPHKTVMMLTGGRNPNELDANEVYALWQQYKNEFDHELTRGRN